MISSPRDTLLIIDDDIEILDFFSVYAVELGYNIYTAPSCSRAREIIKNKFLEIKTIILDWVLSDMSGIDFLKELKSNNIYKDIPVIMYTGYDDDTKMVTSLKGGVYYFLKKPVHSDALFKIVGAAINDYKNLQELKRHKKKELSGSKKEVTVDDIPKTEIKVLLIDDNPDQAVFVKRFLKNGNFIFHFSSDIDKLNETIKDIQPDCVLLDYDLGAKTGLDVIEDLRTVNAGYPFGLIIVTGNESLDLAVETLKAGAQDYLVKDGLNSINLKESIYRAIKSKNLESKLEYLAYHDELTKLANRKFLIDYLKTKVDSSNRENDKFSVVYIDIDKFKDVNDVYGHRVGDDLLVWVSNHIKNAVRDDDVVGRLGGDEFVMILLSVDDFEKAMLVCKKIHENLKTPFIIGDSSLVITLSFGITVYPQDGQTAEELIQNSDVAMYQSKKMGRATISVYNKDMHFTMRRYIHIEDELKNALDKSGFFLLYQPMIDINKKIRGVETLIRWKSEKRGIVSPVDFIPILEKTGLIVPVGYWVIEQACIFIKKLKDEGYSKIYVAVNISPKQFKEDSFFEKVKSIINKIGCDPTWLDFEITESGTMGDAERSIRILRNLKEQGIRVSIDDFGTGYSSLSKLTDFAADVLKIDNSFVFDIVKDRTAQITVKTIIDIGKNLDMSVIAEGVETQEQFDFLSDCGCAEIQGHFFSKPVLQDEFIFMLENK